MPGPYGNISMHGQYLEPLPSTLPAMAPATPPAKRRPAFAEDDVLSPFSVSYATMAGIDLPASSSPSQEATVHVSYPRHPSNSIDGSADVLVLRRRP